MVDPTGFTVVPTGPTTASLDWATATLAGVVDYLVFRRTPPSGALFVPGTDTPRASGVIASAYNDTGLLAATAYEYQVFGRVPAVVGVAPTITSANSASFTQSSPGTFTVTATGTPPPTLSVTGTLPTGVTFTPATGILAGTPTVSGTFPLTFTAANGTLPNATQSFTLTVAVAAWTPASLPNLLGWWQADDLATITASAGAVSQWANKKAGGAHLIQATSANQPQTGTRTLNGRNVIDFDGINDYMDAAIGVNAQPLTVLCVLQNDAPTAVKIEYQTVAGPTHQTYTVSSVWYMNAGSAPGTSAVSASPCHTVSLYNGASSAFYLTGVQYNGAISAGTAGIQGVRLSDGSSAALDAAVAEFVVMGAAISSTDRANWNTYCARWGL